MVEYAEVEAGGLAWRVAGGYEGLFDGGPFADLDGLLRRSRLMKRLAVKRTYEVSAGGRVFFVKVYGSGSWWATLRSAMSGSRARRELLACCGVIERGVSTVPLVAAATRGRESFVVVEKWTGWTSLDELLRRPGLPGAVRHGLLESYGRWARTVHDAGVWQYDFNPSNVLVRESPSASEFRIIDFEKIRLMRRIPERDRLDLLAKLKWHPGFTRTDLHRILTGYVAEHAADRRRMRELADRLRERAERYAIRRATEISSSCVKENRNFGRFEAGRYSGFRRKLPAQRRISETDLERLSRGETPEGITTVASTKALSTWKAANAATMSGGRLPLAVFVGKGGRGFVVFPAGG